MRISTRTNPYHPKFRKQLKLNLRPDRRIAVCLTLRIPKREDQLDPSSNCLALKNRSGRHFPISRFSVIIVKPLLDIMINRITRIEFGSHFDLLSQQTDLCRLVVPIKTINPTDINNRVFPRQPVLSVNHQVLETPGFLIDNEIRDMTK